MKDLKIPKISPKAREKAMEAFGFSISQFHYQFYKKHNLKLIKCCLENERELRGEMIKEDEKLEAVAREIIDELRGDEDE